MGYNIKQNADGSTSLVNEADSKEVLKLKPDSSAEIRSSGLVAATAATLAITPDNHDGRIVALDRAAGVAVTLPAATGSGRRYRFIVKTAVTSNANTIKVDSAAAIMQGLAVGRSAGYLTAADSDTISMNGTTTGGLRGEFWEIIDLAANLWGVRGTMASSSTEATPFSATVS